MNDVFFGSDWHFGHARVIPACGRPFASVEEMDEAMIANWNATVRRGDRIYCLGDLFFHRPEKIREILSRLSGEKFLIKGNHDRDLGKWAGAFVWARDVETIKVKDQKIFLSHYAHRVWKDSHHGAWNLHGHSHGSLSILPGYKQADVGVDCWGFKPVSFDELRPLLDPIEFQPVDHHGKDYAAE